MPPRPTSGSVPFFSSFQMAEGGHLSVAYLQELMEVIRWTQIQAAQLGETLRFFFQMLAHVEMFMFHAFDHLQATRWSTRASGRRCAT